MMTLQTNNHYATTAQSSASTLPKIQAPSVLEVTTALEQILSSCLFIRAHRMCRLLRYLIESSLSKNGRQMSEYAIAFEVFDRNPSTYYPGEDPVVRVQMGRLRRRLRSYYAVSPVDSPVIVSIPLGHYEPIIERRDQKIGDNISNMQSLLSVFPLHYISDDFLGRTLTKGVNEQLNQQFQQAYGASLIPYSASFDVENPIRFFLEGSTFIHGQNLRINIRLIDQTSHAILYTAQFAFSTSANLFAQSSMAEQMCEAVQEFMNGL